MSPDPSVIGRMDLQNGTSLALSALTINLATTFFSPAL
ncbi:MAG: hypothetical protein ACI9AX_002760, partial [Polaromonas sp.]